MFNNVITFIVVLLIFSIHYPERPPEGSWPLSLGMVFLLWCAFAIYCRGAFRTLVEACQRSGSALRGRLTARYHSLVTRLTVSAIFLFALAVYLCGFKYWLQWIPGLRQLSVLQGVSALSLFFVHLCTLWYFAHSAYAWIFGVRMTRRAFIWSNMRLNLPILFPWFFLSLLYDLLGLLPSGRFKAFLNSLEGQILFFALFLIALMIFLPALVKPWWGCKPLGSTEKVRQLQAFLREKGFRVRDLLNWPVFEGKMMTAGIMGVVPRYRYILIADSLMEFLSLEELKAVVAHEMAHARYRHLLFYILFFVGFMTLSFGLFDILTILLSAHPFFSEAMEGRHTHRISLFYLALSVPMVTSLLIYFRYIMGFFMRHFERQADLFSAFIMGTPRYTIRSLEKIADLTGKSRDLPSWHHFSIRERVETLFRSLRHPNLLRRQGRFLILSLAVYFLSMGILGTFLHYGPVKVHLTYALAEKLLTEKLAERPESIPLLQTLAEVYHYREKYEAALGVYEKIIELDPDQAVALNNLAWHLVTLPRKELRNPPRALELAKRAASLQRSAFILDTLAEAYYANGQVSEAVKSIKEALALAREGRGYYEAQLRRFSAAQ